MKKRYILHFLPESINIPVTYTLARELKYQLDFKREGCVACGACTAVCFSGALSHNRPGWELNFKPELCVICGLCVKACPLKLFNIDYNKHV